MYPSWFSSIGSGVLAGAVLLAASAGSQVESALRVVNSDPFALAQAVPLPEGSLPSDTVMLLCDAKQWRDVIGEAEPPSWLSDLSRSALLVGPLNHEFSCANIELRPKSDSNTVTLRPPSASAPGSLGGCAVAVGRAVRGQPITVMGHWMWEHRLASIQSCGERIAVPHTDNADFLRVRLRAQDSETSKAYSLADAKVLVSGRTLGNSRQALAGRDGVAVFQDLPGSSGYEFIVQPRGCGEFRFGNQTVAAGRDSALEFDLGAFVSLAVRVNQDVRGRHVALSGASVVGRFSGEHSQFVGAETDSNGRAILACLPATSELNVHVSYPYHLGEDVCGIQVGPSGRSRIDVLSNANPDPRKRPLPPPGGTSY